jgi:hypothetical protein
VPTEPHFRETKEIYLLDAIELLRKLEIPLIKDQQHTLKIENDGRLRIEVSVVRQL